jgi:hypothetical protein
MKTNILCLIAVFCFLGSCADKVEPKAEEPVQNEDTVFIPADNDGTRESISLEIDGKKKDFWVRSDLVPEFERFQKFIKKYEKKPLEFSIEYSKDLTGDTKNEVVASKILNHDNQWQAINQIRMGNRFIWSDTLTVDDAFCDLQWGEDSIYYALKPYSSFYWCMVLCKDFVNQEKGARSFANEDITLNIRRSTLIKRNMKPKAIAREIAQFKQYLNKFKGYVISEHNSYSNNLYVWYEPEKKFVNIYSPQ